MKDFHKNHFNSDKGGGYFNQKAKAITPETVALNTRISSGGSVGPSGFITVRNPGYRGP